jgi:hypothetical protein
MVLDALHHATEVALIAGVVLGLAALAVPLLWVGRAKPVHDPRPRFGRRSPKALVGGLVLVVISPWLGVLGLVVYLVRKPLRAKVQRTRADRARVAAVCESLEIIAMAVCVGMPIDDMLSLVIRCGKPEARPLFQAARNELAVGGSRREVLRRLAGHGGAPLSSVCEVLIAADRDGAPVALVLDRLAVEAGRAHRLAAEERARRAPVLMLAPLTLCFLPAVLIGTVLPFVLLSFGQTSF